jgi:hypothetical protein
LVGACNSILTTLNISTAYRLQDGEKSHLFLRSIVMLSEKKGKMGPIFFRMLNHRAKEIPALVPLN